MAEPASLPSPETPAEARLIAAAEGGAIAALAGLAPAQRVVRGALLRALLEAGLAARCSGAVVAGPVLLDGLGQDAPAPALELREALPAAGAGIPLLARGARLTALDLSHSRLARLEARGLDCPALTLTGVAIATPDGRVDLEGAHLGAAAALTGVGPGQPDAPGPLLNLAGARLAGGLNLAGARLRELILVGAVVAGDVALDGATLTAIGEEPALLANAARLQGQLRLAGTTVHGQLRLLRATVEGTVLLAGARLLHPGAVALLADGATLGGLDLREATKVRGELRCLGATLRGAVRLDPSTCLHQPGADALTLDQALLAGPVRLAGRVEGGIRLRAAQLAAGLDLAPGSLVQASQGSALLLAEASGAAVVLQGATLAGQLTLTGLRLAGPLHVEGMTLAAAPGQLVALDASGLSAASATLKRLTGSGRLQLDGARLTGPLTLEALALIPAPAAAGAAELADPAAVLSLRGLRTPLLTARGLASTAETVADLRGAQAAELADQGGAGWGAARLRLDDFSYARLAEPSAGNRAARRSRLDFLLRQYPGGRPNAETFSGQPFTQLAQALRHTGHAADADFFARARRRFRRAAGVTERPLGTWADGLAGFFFGDFYSWPRTAATLALWLVLGAGGLWAANLHGALREGEAAACWNPRPGLMLPVLDRHVPLPPAGVALDAVQQAAGLTVPGVPTGWADRCEVAAEAHPGWRWARWAYQGLGAALLLLSAGSLLGLFRRD
jgi:hypothetical protein